MDSLPPDAAPKKRRRGRPRGLGRVPNSGRRKGTPNKSSGELRAIAAKSGPKAIRELRRLAFTSDNPETRLKALNCLLDRGYGRPTQTNEISGPGGSPITLTEFLTALPNE